VSSTLRRPATNSRLANRGILGTAVVAGLFVLLLVVLLGPSMLVPAGLSANETVIATTNVRTSVIQVFGGLALLVGAFFTARTYLLSRHNNQVDRFAKAVGSLGDASRSVRTGGILSLLHLANESNDYWSSVEEMLVVFIRERAQPADNRSRHDQQPEGDQQPEDTATEGPSSDVRIALRVLGKRPRQAPGAPKNRVDLGFLDLSRVDLHGANLDSVRLDGSCLRGAQLSDASLNSASLKRVHLEGAELSSADLRYADLQNATLTDAVFYEALTKGTRVWGCNLDSILLSDAQTAAMDFGDYG